MFQNPCGKNPSVLDQQPCPGFINESSLIFFAKFQATALSSAKKTEKALGPKIKKLEAALAEAESSLEEVGAKIDRRFSQSWQRLVTADIDLLFCRCFDVCRDKCCCILIYIMYTSSLLSTFALNRHVSHNGRMNFNLLKPSYWQSSEPSYMTIQVASHLHSHQYCTANRSKS